MSHGQEQPQRGLLERLEVKIPIETFGSLILRIHDYRNGRNLLRYFQTEAQGVHEKELPNTLAADRAVHSAYFAVIRPLISR
ncbi:hypothetical protein BI364_07230 [Acidihalobacter yilgarnensis]|uniref:Uncharacterized protein n=1 Tax=Acidihalobacter yilgarnensis TaxID=2819280 RepID=A0A1D8IMU0_9GAMM|nr:hypothetical protein BI364_07230 [Acidihalobacter yilgarnensis]